MAVSVVDSDKAEIPAGAGTTTIAFTALENDYALLILSADGTAPSLVTTGYTNAGNFTSSARNDVLYKKMGGTPDTGVEINQHAGTVQGAALYVIRGADLTTFLDVAMTTGTFTGVAPNGPSITPVTDGALVISFVMKLFNAASTGAPSGYSGFITSASWGYFGGNSYNALASKIVSPAAAEDPGDFAGSTGNGDAITLAIRPAAAAVTAALTGTVASSANETTIRVGGATIILTLTGDTWVASGATFNAQRQAIIDGIDSGQAEAGGWDAKVKARQSVIGVVRTSDTVVTITLDAQADYQITAQETITATIPAAALTLAGAVVASPTFTIDTITESTGGAKNMLLLGVG